MNPSTFAARALLASFIEAGVRDIVLCPGSRSAPLAFAAAALDRAGLVNMHVRHDERVGAFTAMGSSKFPTDGANQRPALMITTSGTAVANLHPAVLEADHSRIPLIVLSADRPHELRGVGANQTTNHVGLFASAVRWSVDIPARDQIVDDAAHLTYLQNVATRATAAARGYGSEAGPVHVNLALREPLTPSDDEPAEKWFERLAKPSGLTQVADLSRGSGMVLKADSATVVLAGDSAGPGARTIAEAGGWPLFAEPSSGARSGPNAIGPYRLMLGDSPLAQQIERVVVFGHATLSRPIQQLLARPDVEVVVIHDGPNWPDPPRRAARVVPWVEVEGVSDARWLKQWQNAGVAAREAITRELGSDLNGPNVAQAVVDASGPREILWFGSSNPVRDADLARPTSTDRHPLVAAHRGLAGIDGTVSAASGASLATGLPTRVLIGDLTFIHDLGALIVGPNEPQPTVQLVIFDDNGGGIFETLEQGGPEYRADFERIFGTPHGKNLADIIRGIGIEAVEVSDLDALRDALNKPIQPGFSAIVISGKRTDRRTQARALSEAVRKTHR